MKVDTVMVTGANRGIGLEFVRQLVRLEEPPRFVFATYRNPETSQELEKIQDSSEKSEVVLIKMDVSKPEEIEFAKLIVEDYVGDRGLTLLINNAGIASVLPFPNLTPENLDLHFKINTIGPILVFQSMLPLLEKAAGSTSSGMSVSRAAVLNISSISGSITNAGKIYTLDLVAPGYKISKAALNMSMRVIAANVKEKGILVVMMCPGWVKTDMGTDSAEIEAEESIATMLQTMENLNESHQGLFLHRKGHEYPF